MYLFVHFSFNVLFSFSFRMSVICRCRYRAAIIYFLPIHLQSTMAAIIFWFCFVRFCFSFHRFLRFHLWNNNTDPTIAWRSRVEAFSCAVLYWNNSPYYCSCLLSRPRILAMRSFGDITFTWYVHVCTPTHCMSNMSKNDSACPLPGPPATGFSSSSLHCHPYWQSSVLPLIVGHVLLC